MLDRMAPLWFLRFGMSSRELVTVFRSCPPGHDAKKKRSGSHCSYNLQRVRLDAITGLFEAVFSCLFDFPRAALQVLARVLQALAHVAGNFFDSIGKFGDPLFDLVCSLQNGRCFHSFTSCFSTLIHPPVVTVVRKQLVCSFILPSGRSLVRFRFRRGVFAARRETQKGNTATNSRSEKPSTVTRSENMCYLFSIYLKRRDAEANPALGRVTALPALSSGGARIVGEFGLDCRQALHFHATKTSS